MLDWPLYLAEETTNRNVYPSNVMWSLRNLHFSEVLAALLDQDEKYLTSGILTAVREEVAKCFCSSWDI